MKEIQTKIQSIPDSTHSDDLYTRRVYSKDLWPRNLILARESALPEPSVDLVFWPKTVAALVAVVKLSNEMDFEIFPYGAGSGVCGGATPSAVAKRSRVVVDLKFLDQIESVDSESMIAKIQAGIIGQNLEESLNQKGFTMGHFPSSIYCSSFGGYLASRAAGQLSTYYGKIEDIVLGVEGVLPTGEVFKTPVTPRMAVGPDWNQVFIGSEGTLGFLTSAWVKIHPLPESRTFLSFHVDSTKNALDGIRHWLQAGLRPSVIRLYDEDESRMLMGLKSGVKLICIVEGEKDLTDFTGDQILKFSKNKRNWIDTGAEPAEHWWAHRYDVSYRQQQIMSHQKMILDTFEVSTHWQNLQGLYEAVKNVVTKVGKGQMLVVLAHFSHFYHTGGNIYFSICGRNSDEKPTEEFYDKIWNELLLACESQGGAISHHHGIGRLKAGALKRSNPVLFDLLKRLKHEVDPKNILNPENLGL